MNHIQFLLFNTAVRHKTESVLCKNLSFVCESFFKPQSVVDARSHSLEKLSLGTTIMIGSAFSKDGFYLETIELVREGMIQYKNMVTDEEVIVNTNEAQQLIDASD